MSATYTPVVHDITAALRDHAGDRTVSARVRARRGAQDIGLMESAHGGRERSAPELCAGAGVLVLSLAHHERLVLGSTSLQDILVARKEVPLRRETGNEHRASIRSRSPDSRNGVEDAGARAVL
jgi:hypothetical protein